MVNHMWNTAVYRGYRNLIRVLLLLGTNYSVMFLLLVSAEVGKLCWVRCAYIPKRSKDYEFLQT